MLRQLYSFEFFIIAVYLKQIYGLGPIKPCGRLSHDNEVSVKPILTILGHV